VQIDKKTELVTFVFIFDSILKISAMKRITLAPYAVRVKKAYTRREYEITSSFSEDDDLCDILHRFLLGLSKKASLNKDLKQVLEAEDISLDDREIEGTLNSGEYGVEGLIRDVNTWKVTYRKKTNEAEMLPFYFLFDLPEARTKGFLLLQRTGVFGIHSALTSVLGALFTEEFPEYRLVVNPVVPQGLIDQYVGADAEMTEIRFIRHSLSSDISARLSASGREKGGTMELVVKLKEKGGFPFRSNVRRVLNGQRELQNMIELEEIRFPYDNVKIKVRVGGKDRVVDLGHPERLRAEYDVTEDLKFSPSGHPTFESIAKAAHDLLADHLAVIYGEE
jgi:hypothetical protein